MNERASASLLLRHGNRAIMHAQQNDQRGSPVVVVVALAALVSCSTSASAQRFRHLETQRNFPRADFVLEAADLNRDGRDDIVVGGRVYYPEDGRAEHRFQKSVVRVLFGTRTSRFRPAPGGFVQGTVRARWPIVVAADFNNDHRPDLAVFDQGSMCPRKASGWATRHSCT